MNVVVAGGDIGRGTPLAPDFALTGPFAGLADRLGVSRPSTGPLYGLSNRFKVGEGGSQHDQIRRMATARQLAVGRVGEGSTARNRNPVMASQIVRASV